MAPKIAIVYVSFGEKLSIIDTNLLTPYPTVLLVRAYCPPSRVREEGHREGRRLGYHFPVSYRHIQEVSDRTLITVAPLT